MKTIEAIIASFLVLFIFAAITACVPSPDQDESVREIAGSEERNHNEIGDNSTWTNTIIFHSEEEALDIGHGFLMHSISEGEEAWASASVAEATPMYSSDNILQAFEVRVVDTEGEDSGYLIVESHELQGPVSEYSTSGVGYTQVLSERYEEEYGEALPSDKSQVRYLWAGFGHAAVEVSLKGGDIRRVVAHPELGEISFKFSDRAKINFTSGGITEEEWREETAQFIDTLRNY